MRFSKFLIPLLVASLSPVESAGQHRVIHSVIDGVPLVRTEGGPKYSGPLFEIEEDISLGIDEGEPEWQIFFRSPSILAAPDGKMVLVDDRKCAIYILTQEGELIVELGGSGSGPGEFRQPYMGMWVVPGESFLINDYSLNRATRYSMTGELLGIDNYMEVMGGRIMRFDSLGNNRFLAHRSDSAGPRVAGHPLEIIHQYWFLSSQLEPVGEPIEIYSRASFAPTPNTGTAIPFLREKELIPYLDGRILLSDPDEGRLTILSTFGDPLMYIERDWERPRVSAGDKREGKKYFLEHSQEYMRRIANRIPFPSRHAAFSGAFTDDRGRIWVEYIDGPRRIYYQDVYRKFDVFGPDGVWLGVQELDFYPWEISGDSIFRHGDVEGDGPRIRRLHLRPLVPEAAGEIRP